ncbi:serine palmitoyltransferase component, partial [Friedmanniomyces endolithicus]
NPVLILVLKDQHIEDRKLSIADQEALLQDAVEEALANGVLVTRLKSPPMAVGASVKEAQKEWRPRPGIKVCVTTGLSRKETEAAGKVVRHAITSVMKGRKWQKGTLLAATPSAAPAA